MSVWLQDSNDVKGEALAELFGARATEMSICPKFLYILIAITTTTTTSALLLFVAACLQQAADSSPPGYHCSAER